jgi:tetratricopeptide (TPR) repeat protein
MRPMIRHRGMIGGVLAALLTSCSHEAVFVRSGQLALARGQWTTAEQEFQKALAEQADSVPALIGVALADVGLGRLSDAEELLAKAQARTPAEDAPGRNEVALAYAQLRARQNRLDDAARLCQEVVVREPEAAWPRYFLGAVDHRAGKLDEARATLEVATQRDPALLEAYLELGLVLDGLDRRDEATAALKRGLRLNPRGDPVRLAALYVALAGLYEKSRRFEEARLTFAQASGYDAGNADAVLGHGRSLRLLGKLDEALGVLKPAASRAPKDARFQYELARTYLAYPLKPQGLAAARLALQLDPSRPEYHLVVISLADPAGDATDEGFKLLDGAARVLRDDFDLQVRAGRAAFDGKKWRTAIEAFRRAIALKPGDVDANYRLGLAELRSGDVALARDAVTALSTLDPSRAADLQREVDAVSTPASAAPPEATKPVAAKPKAKAKAPGRRH